MKTKRLYRHLLGAIVLLISAACGHDNNSNGQKTTGKDSIYTIEYINHISLTQPHRALALLDTMEQREMLKPSDINGLRAVINENGLGQTNVALKYVKRIYDSEEMKSDTALAVKTLNMLTGLSYQNAHYADALKYANEGTALAHAAGDNRTEAYILQYAGYTLSELGRIDEAIGCIDRSIAVLESLGSDKDFGVQNLILFGKLKKANIYMDKEQYDKAIATFGNIQETFDKLKSADNLPEGVVMKYHLDIQSLFLWCYTYNGMMKEAQQIYEALAKMPLDPFMAKRLAPYLIKTRQYDKALYNIQQAKQFFVSGRDTITQYYIDNILMYEKQTLMGMGHYKDAIHVADMIAAITDSIVNREKQQEVQELAVIYDTADKEMQIAQQAERLRSGLTILTLALLLLMIAVIVIIVIVRYNRIIKIKNRAAVATIDELMAAREKLELTTSQTETTEEEKPETTAQEEETTLSAVERLKEHIEAKQMYLDPLFDRSKAVEVFPGLNIRTLSAEFNQKYGMSFPKYLSSLRLNHALGLLCSDSQMSVEAISAKSGFTTRQTFYRMFMEKYGITPAEYRKLKGKES